LDTGPGGSGSGSALPPSSRRLRLNLPIELHDRPASRLHSGGLVASGPLRCRSLSDRAAAGGTWDIRCRARPLSLHTPDSATPPQRLSRGATRTRGTVRSLHCTPNRGSDGTRADNRGRRRPPRTGWAGRLQPGTDRCTGRSRCTLGARIVRPPSPAQRPAATRQARAR
jgi:hypothetical protein